MKKTETARVHPPTDRTEHGDALAFRVWVDETDREWASPWRCVAMFRYLTECLDYIAYCQDRGSDVIFQSPAETKPIKSTDRRAVYKENQ